MNGKPGRPKRTLKKGVKVRIKNKGSQSHKKGRKRPKYEAPCPEHPETTGDIQQSDIHADHVENQNAALRRKCSAFRRKTNTYAKSKGGLQRALNVYWAVHNFPRVHHTTKEVPEVVANLKEAMELHVSDENQSAGTIPANLSLYTFMDLGELNV